MSADVEEEDYDSDDGPQEPVPDDGEGSDFDELQVSGRSQWLLFPYCMAAHF